jgi:uncharacterized membrane protein
MNKLKMFFSNLRTSFLFVPSLIVAVSIAMSAILILLESVGSWQWMSRWPRMFGMDADGARGMLSTIAGSMMTVVGITFSMTLMTLMLASSQYTSRILRNFIRDRVTQVVLGIFAGNFTYCLIVLRTIRSSGAEAEFVPRLAVFFGIVFAIGGIGALIFFIHHIASSIQASSIIASVANETMETVRRLCPENPADKRTAYNEDQLSPHIPDQIWQPVLVKGNGYIQSVNDAALLRLACEHNTIVRMERGVGEFVVNNTILLSLALESPPGNEIIAALQAAYSISRHRTLQQDYAFGVRQIVDMALRALSPSVNDTTTAIMCVDYLTAILAHLATRDIPSLYHYQEEKLRVIAIGQTFTGMVAESFDQIRSSAVDNVAIMLRMLGSLQTIASLTVSSSQRQTLRDQVHWIIEFAERTIESPHDRAKFESRLALLRQSGMVN